MTPTGAPFAAAVLAGGRSRRMGTDKAALQDKAGQTLLARQLALLHGLGPDELIVSARRGQDLPAVPNAARRIDDTGADGPLGGIVAVLRAIRAPRLLVLAVDLPSMNREVLRQLLAAGDAVVPRVAGRFEPLVAVYPRRWLPVAEAALERGERSLQPLVADSAGPGGFAPVLFADEQPFLNWNQPEDYPRVN